MVGRALLSATLLALVCSPAQAQTAKRDRFCENLRGAELIGAGKVFLGYIEDRTHPLSAFNPDGKYGKHRSPSIWNENSRYGARRSDFSAIDSYATNPPEMRKRGRREVLFGDFMGYLSTNKAKINTFSPEYIFTRCIATYKPKR